MKEGDKNNNPTKTRGLMDLYPRPVNDLRRGGRLTYLGLFPPDCIEQPIDSRKPFRDIQQLVIDVAK
jgi:hypothetical protein